MISLILLSGLVMLNFIFFSSSSLTKKTLSFILMVIFSLWVLPLWVSLLLLLLYIGGLFIVLTYIITFSFFQEKYTLFFIFLVVTLCLLFSPLKMNLSESSFYFFSLLVNNNWFAYPICILLLGLFLVSKATPASKSIRGGF